MSDFRIFSIGALAGALFGLIVVDPNGAWPGPLLYVGIWSLFFAFFAVAIFSRQRKG